MTKKINYAKIEIPTKPRTDFNYVERRAELLRLAVECGHPDLLPKQNLAREFDVSPATITKDLTALAEFVSENLGQDSDFLADVIFKKGMRALVEKGNYAEVRRFIQTWQDWLMARGAINREPDKLKIDKNERIIINIQGMEDKKNKETAGG